MTTSFSPLWAPLADNISWPCAMRLSARVKRAKIRVDGQGFVELVIPQKSSYTPVEVQKFLESMLPWLQKTLDGIVARPEQAQRAAHCLQKITGSLEADILPISIALPMLQENWQLEIQHKRGGYVKVQEMGNLVLYAHSHEVRLCCKVLQKWLMRKALIPLQECTQAKAAHLGLHVGKVSIGAQKGRWGSCSSEGNIRLNCRLLLLPVHLVEHVILHELCHRVYMNHSKDFKALLEKVSPQSLHKDKELERAWRELPLWSLIS